jgi:hypothetical protein
MDTGIINSCRSLWLSASLPRLPHLEICANSFPLLTLHHAAPRPLQALPRPLLDWTTRQSAPPAVPHPHAARLSPFLPFSPLISVRVANDTRHRTPHRCRDGRNGIEWYGSELGGTRSARVEEVSYPLIQPIHNLELSTIFPAPGSCIRKTG